MLRALNIIGLSVMVLAAPAAQAQPSVSFFRELPDLDVGASPSAVATADFNGDGKIDIAVANSDSDDVSVLLGNGDGTFLDSGATFPVDQEPVAIAIGDFNHDTKPDIITANDIGNSVSVLLNQTVNKGPVTFGQAVTTATGTSPEAVVVGDFDGDANPDVATADNLDNTVTVLKGVGDGTFTLPQAYAVGEFPMGLATGFLDSDANLDLVVTNSAGGANGSGTITVLKGLGGEVFVPQPEIPVDCGAQTANGCCPVAVVVAKLDNADSNLDLAVLNYEGENVSILLGDGQLGFQARSTVSVGSFPPGIVADDFNGDGKTDIATSSSFDDNVSVLIGVGDGTFMPAVNFDVGTGPAGIAVGKFNGDGKPDLVCANQEAGSATSTNGTVSILLNTTGLCVGDCNLDGQVTVDDLLTMASIALGNAPLAECPVADINQDMRITVDEIVAATNNAITGCTK